MDKILIKDLLLRCTIGVSAEERREKEDIVINIELSLDLRSAGKYDNMNSTINYRDLKKRIILMVEHSQYSLIEALADRIASLCLECSGVIEVKVVVEKPGALRFARSVGVEVQRKEKEVKISHAFIGIGSNINPEENILMCIELLKKQLTLATSSTFYQTMPIGNRNDPTYINGVVLIETKYSPESLKNLFLHPIEDKLGRVRTNDKFASRTIDLDILLYDDLVVKQDNLNIPDPDILERNFLVASLNEIAPQLIPPGWTKKFQDLKVNMTDQGIRALPELSDLIRKKIKA